MRAAMDKRPDPDDRHGALVRDGGREIPGLLLYTPVYDTSLPPGNAIQRAGRR